MIDSKKINTSIKLYPLFYAFSADLIFFVPIDTLFLTLVKGLNASQISTITMIGLLVCILSKGIVISTTKKIGNTNSIKLGALMLLISSIIVTFGNSFISMIIYEIIKELAFMFLNMTSILLKNDLIALNKDNDYFLIKNKANVMYGVMTMITALISGYLFNVDRYITMYISIVVYFIVFLLSFIFYEAKVEKQEQKNTDKKLKITSTIFLVILSNALFFSVIKLGQNNSKLFMQYDFQKILPIETVTYYITIIVFLSRVARIIGNVIFGKLYLKMKDKISTILTLLECMAFFLLIVGHFISFNFILKVVIMSLGFFLILAIRDSFKVYIEDTALKITNPKEQKKILINIDVYGKLSRLLLNGIFTIILIKYELIVIEVILLLLSIFEIIINRKMYKQLQTN